MNRLSIIGICLALTFANQIRAHDEPESRPFAFLTETAEVEGTLLTPPGHEKVPCVLIVGGSLSHTRDGMLTGRPAPKRDALKRLAEELCAAGYASYRYDKVGYGASQAMNSWDGSYQAEAKIVAAAIAQLRKHKEIGKIIIAGESAGAYLACLAAKDGVQADAYMFLGGLCGSSESMYEHAFGPIVEFAERGAEQRIWAETRARQDLAMGRHWKAMLAAAAKGEDSFEIVDGSYKNTIKGLKRRREEAKFPPDEMFKLITAPALALSGEFDMNVPPDHGKKAAQIMTKAGNKNAKSVLIAGVDHSFQKVPGDEETRIKERYSFQSFTRPYEPRLYQEIVAWLKQTVPSPSKGGTVEKTPGQRAFEKLEIDPKTATTPERVQLAPGIEIIADITSKEKTAAVETLEGRIGPLLLAEKSQAHFIDMQGGIYVEEHGHSTESIIYTVKGQWVLCSKGRRYLMKPGTLFRFEVNTPTGYEVPFKESAFILIFKGARTTKVEKEFIDYLKGFQTRLEKEHKEGVPYMLTDLKKDHAALKFAREVNPKFDADFPAKR